MRNKCYSMGGPTHQRGTRDEEQGQEIEPFVGIVKSYFLERGWGHIKCDKTFEEHQKDIPFAASAAPGGCKAGMWVEFHLLSGRKGVSAVNLKQVSAPPPSLEPSSFRPSTSGGSSAPPQGKGFFNKHVSEVRARLDNASHGKASWNVTDGEVRPAAHLQQPSPKPAPRPKLLVPKASAISTARDATPVAASMQSIRPNAASGRHQLPPPPPPPPAWSTQHSKRHHADEAGHFGKRFRTD